MFINAFLQKFHRIEYSESLEWYQHGKLRPHTDAGLVTTKAGEAIGVLLCNLSPFLHPFNIVVLQSSTLPPKLQISGMCCAEVLVQRRLRRRVLQSSPLTKVKKRTLRSTEGHYILLRDQDLSFDSLNQLKAWVIPPSATSSSATSTYPRASVFLPSITLLAGWPLQPPPAPLLSQHLRFYFGLWIFRP